MKYFLLVILTVIVFSCKKDYSHQGKVICTEGTLRYVDPVVDGTGWTLQESDTSSTFFLLQEDSIPDSVKINNLKVTVCIEETKNKFRFFNSPVPNEESIYKIVSIKKR